MNNRGRFQAQGLKLEESEPWTQSTPLFFNPGLALLLRLKDRIPEKERNARLKGFTECQRFITNASENNGINVQFMNKPLIKSFPKNHKERVDLEVRLGIAFIKNTENETESEEKVYKEKFKDFLLDEKIYLEIEDYWRNATEWLAGSVVEEWVTNYYANGKKILDGNPIFSFRTQGYLACRIILSKRDSLLPTLMSWNSSYVIDDISITELVITIQPYKQTFIDSKYLIEGFLKGIYKTIQAKLNKKYENLTAVKRIRQVAKVFDNQTKFREVDEVFFIDKRFDINLFKQVEGFSDRIEEFTLVVHNETLKKNYKGVVNSLNDFKKVINLNNRVNFNSKISKVDYVNEIVRKYSSVKRFTIVYNDALNELEARIKHAKNQIEMTD